MENNSRIYIAGHRGLVGSAVVRALRANGYDNLLLRTSSELDLRNKPEVDDFLAKEQPEYVLLAAAKVGGILANDTYPADFIRDNLQIQTNVIDAAYRNGVKRLLFLGSSCIYPKLAPQPMPESCMLTGELEPTNQWYAIAKIAGIKMCQAYHKQYGFDAVSVMPTNLYGPNDSFDLERSHVLPAMIRKFHLAKLAQAGEIEAINADEARYGTIPVDILENLGIERVRASGESHKHALSDLHDKGLIIDPRSSARNAPKVVLWGSGSPFREFLYVDDMAAACLFLLALPNSRFISYPSRLFNVGIGSDITIKAVAKLVQAIVGYDGEVAWDSSRPDGTFRKLMDVSVLNSLGWKASVGLEDGIKNAYQSYISTRCCDD